MGLGRLARGLRVSLTSSPRALGSPGPQSGPAVGHDQRAGVYLGWKTKARGWARSRPPSKACPFWGAASPPPVTRGHKDDEGPGCAPASIGAWRFTAIAPHDLRRGKP